MIDFEDLVEALAETSCPERDRQNSLLDIKREAELKRKTKLLNHYTKMFDDCMKADETAAALYVQRSIEELGKLE